MSIRSLEREYSRQLRRRRWTGFLFGVCQICVGIIAIFPASTRVAGIAVLAIGTATALFAVLFPDGMFNFTRWVLAGAFTGSALGLLCAGFSVPQYFSAHEFIGALATDMFILVVLAVLGGIVGVVIGLVQVIRGKTLAGDDVASGIGEVGEALSDLDT